MVKDDSELDGLNHKEPEVVSFSEMGNQERKRFFFLLCFYLRMKNEEGKLIFT